ncbi:MAG: TlpA family protein disulfide reductase [Acidimicrobiia bacterium]|nr:TlpA family protein disulfide reductase [Acidimicrobiia bacterium]
MKHPTRWIAITAGVVALLLGVVFVVLVGADDESTGGRLLGKEVPVFDLPTLDGAGVSSDDLAGRSYLVNFWNSWCVPCRQEHPALVEFYERHRDDRDFEMIGIVRDDTEKAARDYVEDEGVEWIVALDPENRSALAFGTTGQPETFFVGPDGIVTGVHIGPASVARLEEMLAVARGLGQ